MEVTSIHNLMERLSAQANVREIIINSPTEVFVDAEGNLVKLKVKLDPQDIEEYCQKIASLNRQSFGQDSPILDGNTEDGSRINIISAMYRDSAYPAITIRKFLKTIDSFDTNPDIFGLNKKWILLLKALVSSRQNILISGGTSRGKTTFLNLLLQEVSKVERVVAIEDTKELSFNLPNTVRLFAKSLNFNIEHPLNIKDLLKNSLRMRPDRIIIGEVRSSEAFDLLQAMNTGHDGSMSTIHATSGPRALGRLETLSMFAGVEIPLIALRKQISEALDYIVQLERNSDGIPVVDSILEVGHMEGDIILTQKIASYDGKLKATGTVPSKLKDLVKVGLPENFFYEL